MILAARILNEDFLPEHMLPVPPDYKCKIRNDFARILEISLRYRRERWFTGQAPSIEKFLADYSVTSVADINKAMIVAFRNLKKSAETEIKNIVEYVGRENGGLNTLLNDTIREAEASYRAERLSEIKLWLKQTRAAQAQILKKHKEGKFWLIVGFETGVRNDGLVLFSEGTSSNVSPDDIKEATDCAIDDPRTCVGEYKFHTRMTRSGRKKILQFKFNGRAVTEDILQYLMKCTGLPAKVGVISVREFLEGSDMRDRVHQDEVHAAISRLTFEECFADSKYWDLLSAFSVKNFSPENIIYYPHIVAFVEEGDYSGESMKDFYENHIEGEGLNFANEATLRKYALAKGNQDWEDGGKCEEIIKGSMGSIRENIKGSTFADFKNRWAEFQSVKKLAYRTFK